MEYYLKEWQIPSVDGFMDKFGVDAGVEMLIDFEVHGSLGRAMIKIAHKIKKKEKHDIQTYR